MSCQSIVKVVAVVEKIKRKDDERFNRSTNSVLLG
jgi:hypothetical protein